MNKPVEYELELPDGSKRFEIVDPDCGYPPMQQIAMFMHEHGATKARPVEQPR